MTDDERSGDERSGDGPPLWADLALTVWVIVVGVLYFGGYFAADLGLFGQMLQTYMPSGKIAYAVLLLIGVVRIAFRHLRGASVPRGTAKERKAGH